MGRSYVNYITLGSAKYAKNIFFNYSLIKCVFAKFFGGKTEEESELNIGVF